MTEPLRFLLVQQQADLAWTEVLARSIDRTQGVLTLALPADLENLDVTPFALVLLDLTGLDDPVSRVREIRRRDPEARVVVFAPAPHVKQGRELYRENIIDYVRKLGDEDGLHKILVDNLSRRPLNQRWRREDLPGEDNTSAVG